MLRLFSAVCAGLAFAISPFAHAATDHADVPIALTTDTGQINGSLMLPSHEKKIPVVLIIAGSGPTDRDGNNRLAGVNNSLKMLATALADAGIASVRYDKRGIGASVTPGVREADLRFDTYVRDAALWVAKLNADQRFSGVAVLGHSEGSLIGMLASKGQPARAFISLSGPAQGASAILRQQLRGKLPGDLAERNEAILVSLEKGQVAQDVPAPLASLYRDSVQPYLISWFKYVPATELKTLTMPTLIVQGDTDIQVGVAEAKALKAAKPDAELVIIEGMNHVLKSVPADHAKQLASYGDPSLPLADGLSASLVRFLTIAFQNPQGTVVK